MIVERLVAWGHPNVRATHRTTLEFTKEKHLTPRGDCVVAVSAEKGLNELGAELKRTLRTERSRVKVVFEVGALKEVIFGSGSPELVLSHPTDFVLRKSRYICPRTLMIMADKAACDLSRSVVKALREPNTWCGITIIVRGPDRSEAEPSGTARS